MPRIVRRFSRRGKRCQLRCRTFELVLRPTTRGALARKTGDPGMTRTCDLRFRKPSLYPAELRDRLDIASELLKATGFCSDFAPLRKPPQLSFERKGQGEFKQTCSGRKTASQPLGGRCGYRLLPLS